MRSISRSVFEIADASVDGATMKKNATEVTVQKLTRNYATVDAKQGIDSPERARLQEHKRADFSNGRVRSG